jgi:NAD(P)-dependent dehydrogenase (short-subunit alcohol dehydrogenase family)
MKILDDKVIVVAGVGPGIGHSLAVNASAHGAKLVLCARTASRLDDLVAEIESSGGDAVAVPCDMSIVADCQKAASVAMERYGKIDGVAVIACMEPDRKMFDEAAADFSDWRSNVDFNLWATMQFVKACLTHMTSGGSIVLSGSTSSDFPDAGVAAYAAAKAGLASMIRSIAYEYSAKFSGGRGIRLNMLSYGAIAGEPFHKWVQEIADISGRTYEQQLKRISRNYPLGYVPTPDEYANGVVMLLSDLSKAFNGLNIHINGGLFMKP